MLERLYPTARSFESFPFDELFRGLERLARDSGRAPPERGGAVAPRATLEEEPERYVLRVEVPGALESSVKVELSGGALAVSAERAVSYPEGQRVLRAERTPLRFERTVAFGDAVDPERVTAELRDGVLTVGVGKRAAGKKTIPVTSA